MVVFYTLLFAIPSLATLAYTGGRTQLSPEDLLQSDAAQARARENFGPEDEERRLERRAMMNKVLFETRGTLGKPDWAIKRDEERKRQQGQH